MITANIEFKTIRQEKEFDLVEARVQALIFYVARLMKAAWNHQAVVTCLHRDEEENNAAGGKANSAHLHWRAADIRLKDFKDKKNIDILLSRINSQFKRMDGLPTAIAHGVGDNYHLHLQVPK